MLGWYFLLVFTELANSRIGIGVQICLTPKAVLDSIVCPGKVT